LIALSSVANCAPVDEFGNTYFAGIWGAQLVKCLSWRSVRSCSTISRASCLAIAPSWSWASVPGRIEYAGFGSVLEEKMLSLAEPSNSYGNFEGRTLELLARLCSISLPTDDQPGPSPELWDIYNPSINWGMPYWDETQDHSVANKIYTVVPLSVSFFDRYSKYRYIALIVTLLPSAGDDGPSGSCKVYRRIGYVEWECYWRNVRDLGDKVYERPDVDLFFETHFPNAVEQTIVLV
jgi:hypothetical protein